MVSPCPKAWGQAERRAENAFKLAFMAYKQRERGNTDFTSSEMGECLRSGA